MPRTATWGGANTMSQTVDEKIEQKHREAERVRTDPQDRLSDHSVRTPVAAVLEVWFSASEQPVDWHLLLWGAAPVLVFYLTVKLFGML